MTNVPMSPSSLRGAVDLSALADPRRREPSGAPSTSLVRSASDATFTDILDLSNTLPVIVEFFGQGTVATLGDLIGQYGGRLVLATVDAVANPQLREAFQVTQVPTVAAVVAGRPVQLYVGDLPEADVRRIFDQVLELGAEHGATGQLDAEAAAEPVEEPLPPHHQEAFDAISAGDYATAIAEYKTAIAQNPRDSLAVAGLAQVGLLQRLEGVSESDVRALAATGDLAASLSAADLDVSGGDAASAFELLLTLFPTLDAAGKNTVRTRLVDYFEILGTDDPLVVAARRRLTALLF